MPDFTKARRGLSAIEDAASNSGSKGSGDFKPFAPQIQWREDQEEKFILALTPIDSTFTVDMHEWIPVGEGQKNNGDSYTKYESFISRKDPLIGEDSDELEDRLKSRPRRRTLGVAVELEPIMENVRGRKRPKGFGVKLDSFTRNDEEVTLPVIGIVSQSSANFWGWLGSYDNTQAPITETPMQVVRRGTDAKTTYDFIPFMDHAVDLSGLFDNIGNISYLNQEGDATEYSGEDDYATAISIGNALLEKRVDELADAGRYESLVSPIQEYKPKFSSSIISEENTTPQPVVTSGGTSDKSDRFAALRQRVEGS